MTGAPALPPAFERSARRDVRWWALFLIGAVFMYAGSVVDPQSNCSEGGECAPWLVPVAYLVGMVAAAAGAGHLWANPRRGSCFDPLTGELVWWQNRTFRHSGVEGRIAPERISRIRIVPQDDSADAVHLYDLGGERQPYFDSEVIPWPYDRWAGQLAARYPGIRIETA